LRVYSIRLSLRADRCLEAEISVGLAPVVGSRSLRDLRGRARVLPSFVPLGTDWAQVPEAKSCGEAV